MVSLRNAHCPCQQGETSHHGLHPQINIKGGDFIHVAFGYGLALMVGICVSGGVSGGRLALLSLAGEDNSKPPRPSQPCSDLGYGCDEEASLGPVAGERVIKSVNIRASAFQVYWAGQYLAITITITITITIPGVLGRAVLGRLCGKPCPLGKLRGRDCSGVSRRRQHDTSDRRHFFLFPFLLH